MNKLESREELEKVFLQKIFNEEENRYYLDNITKDFFVKYKKELEIFIDLHKKAELNVINLLEKDENMINIITNDYLYNHVSLNTIYNRLLEKNNKNAIYNKITEITKEMPNKDVPEILADLENVKESVNTVNEDVKISQILGSVIDEMTTPDTKTIIKTGIKDIDDMIYGFQDNNYVIIGARPGCGKTALALQIALNNLKKGKKILYISLEMDRSDICKRLVCNQSKLRANTIYDTYRSPYTDKIMADVSEAIKNISTMNLYIEDKICEHKEIIYKIKSHILRNDIDMVIVDYIGLIKSETKSYSREREIAEISRDFKLLTRDYKVPIICLTQLNRDGADGEPSSASIRESDSLLNDANKVFLLWQDEDQYEQEVSILNCKCVKNREGRIGKAEIKFDKPVQMITSFTEEERKILEI